MHHSIGMDRFFCFESRILVFFFDCGCCCYLPFTCMYMLFMMVLLLTPLSHSISCFFFFGFPLYFFSIFSFFCCCCFYCCCCRCWCSIPFDRHIALKIQRYRSFYYLPLRRNFRIIQLRYFYFSHFYFVHFPHYCCCC